MTDRTPRYRTGKLCYIEIPAVDENRSAQFAWFADPAGNVLGIYQQPGLAKTEQAATEASRG